VSACRQLPKSPLTLSVCFSEPSIAGLHPNGARRGRREQGRQTDRAGLLLGGFGARASPSGFRLRGNGYGGHVAGQAGREADHQCIVICTGSNGSGCRLALGGVTRTGGNPPGAGFRSPVTRRSRLAKRGDRRLAPDLPPGEAREAG